MIINKAVISLTKASIKMYFRNKASLFWSLFFPFVLIVVFGLVFKNTNSSATAVVSYPQNSNVVLTNAITNLKKIPGLTVKTGSYNQNIKDIKNGNADLALDFQQTGTTQKTVPCTPSAGCNVREVSYPIYSVNAYYVTSNQEQLGTLLLGIQYYFSQEALAENSITPTFTVNNHEINQYGLKYTDFLLPGIIALGVMQAALFGIIGSIVAYKERKILRRLIVTPLTRVDFVISQVLTYLITCLLQIFILLVLGVNYLHTKIVGNIPSIILLAFLGSIVFTFIGFAVSGRAKTVNTAMPIAQIISLPMMFLSGVFFPTNGYPEWLTQVVNHLPLTYLVDGIRNISTKGYTLMDVKTDLIGLIVWIVIGLILAVNFFKWE